MPEIVFECGFGRFKYFVYRVTKKCFVAHRYWPRYDIVSIAANFYTEEEAVSWCITHRIQDEKDIKLIEATSSGDSE